MRILITGSRNWTDRLLISRTILQEINAHCGMLIDAQNNPIRRDTERVTIVHGGAAGADLLAHNWARYSTPPIRTEPHPVTRRDWQEFPKMAGFMRNAAMVDLGADVCLAFIRPCSKPSCTRMEPHGSHGASQCSDLAESKGIRTRRIE